MANADNRKLVKIYGVTLAEKSVRPYGHGVDDIEIDGKIVKIGYVDYFIDDLVALIKNQKLEKVIIKKLKGGNE